MKRVVTVIIVTAILAHPAIAGTITGIVTRDSDGSPVAGLSIKAYDYGTNQYCGSDDTGGDGFYVIENLDAGTYRVLASTSGTSYVQEYYDDVVDYDSATAVEVNAGQVTQNIDFSLALGGSISGTVTDSKGVALSGLWVSVSDYGTNQYYGSDYTNADGFYVIENLHAGTYRVLASTSGTSYVQEYYDDVLDYDSATAVEVNAGQVTQNIDFSLALGGSISGTVTDSNGLPISGLWVGISDYETNHGWDADDTDANGVYVITMVAPGTYRVNVETSNTDYVREFYDDQVRWDRAAPVSVSAEQQIANIDFSLELGASLSGYVKNLGGTPIEGVEVVCNSDHYPYAQNTTDSNGFYKVRGLTPGYVYNVAAYPPATTDYVINRIYVGIPDVNDYTANDINLSTGALTVSGQVTDKYTGDKLNGILVGGHLDELDVWSGNNYTDANGIYEVTGLPPCEIDIRALPQFYYAIMGAEIELTEDINNLDFALPPEARLSGKVLDAETAQPLVGIEMIYWNNSCAAHLRRFTDPDGFFHFTNLPPGIAEISARPEVDTGYACSLPFVSNFIYLAEGQYCSGRIIALQKGALVSGYVNDPNGNPLSNIECDYKGRLSDGDFYSDIDGHYELRLPLGTYAIYLDEDDLAILPPKITITDISQPVDVNMTVYSAQTGGQISGNVNNPGGYAKTGAFVVVAFEAGAVIDANSWYTIQPIKDAGLGQAGPFSISTLPPDANYDVHLCVISQTLDDIMSVSVHDSALNVTVGTTDIILNYNSEGSTVTGSVINTNGQPILGATVLLNDPCTNMLAGIAHVDPNGNYVIYNVPAGTYDAVATHSKYLNASVAAEVVDGVPVDVGTITMPFTGEKEGADLNGDGIINMPDFAEFGNQWQLSGPLKANFDQQGDVDFADLLRLTENWLWKAIWIND